MEYIATGNQCSVQTSPAPITKVLSWLWCLWFCQYLTLKVHLCPLVYEETFQFWDRALGQHLGQYLTTAMSLCPGRGKQRVQLSGSASHSSLGSSKVSSTEILVCVLSQGDSVLPGEWNEPRGGL